MKFILAMDSMKECLTSKEANAALHRGIQNTCPNAEIVEIAMSDGGDGFLEAMGPKRNISCLAHDAMMRPITVNYGATDKTAIIEVARVIGLSMIEPELRNVLKATSFGLGEVVYDAWQKGFSNIIVGLGGSATSDCGIGMLEALKQQIARRKNIPYTAPFDTSLLKQLNITLATDVKAPLLGLKGAAHVFAPQKGATPEIVELLERKARTFAEMAAKHQGFDKSMTPGAGAAGGLGYAFLQFTNAKIKAGAEIVCEKNGLNSLIQANDIIITGEGHSDRQTLMGKLPQIILNYAKEKKANTILVAGKIDDLEDLKKNGFDKIININEGYNDETNPLKKEVATRRLTVSAEIIGKQWMKKKIFHLSNKKIKLIYLPFSKTNNHL
jgi:glycerate kinase